MQDVLRSAQSELERAERTVTHARIELDKAQRVMDEAIATRDAQQAKVERIAGEMTEPS